MSERRSAFQLAGTGAVGALEEKLRKHFGMRRALCVSSATTGLLAVALAMELRRADFITTPYTWGGTLAGWLLMGNRPRFADIDPVTLCLDPGSAARAVTPATRAILAADIYGVPCDQQALRRLADELGIWYVADAAQSLGARRDGRPASALADAVVVSFTTGKTVDAGEGGAVLTNRDDIYERLLWHTQHPLRQRRELGSGLDNEFALNGRIHPWAATRAVATFDARLSALARRRYAAADLIGALNGSGLTQPIDFSDRGIEPAFFRVTAAWRRNEQSSRLGDYLSTAGWVVAVGPAPVRLVYRQTGFLAQFARCRTGARCPVAEQQARRRFCVTDFRRRRSSLPKEVPQ
jgi:perosamine synthetase